jgi:hypothetical protein
VVDDGFLGASEAGEAEDAAEDREWGVPWERGVGGDEGLRRERGVVVEEGLQH